MTIAYRELDPRAKLSFTVVVAVLAVAIPDLTALAGLGGLILGTIAVGPGRFRRDWIGTLAPFKILIPVIFVLNAFFYGSGSVLWAVSTGGLSLRLTTGGLHQSTVIATRLVVLAGVASWFALTTDAEEFEAALVRLGVPWSFAFVLSLTVRLVPEMRDRYRTIEEAQRSRGLVLEGGPLARARARIPMFIPFFVSVVNYGYELSEALVIRDFGDTDPRTSVVQLDHSPGDYVCYLGSAAILIVYVGVFVV